MATKTLPQYKIANQELFHNYKKNQDLQTRNEIIHLNLGLVKKEVCHWLNRCQENYDDLLFNFSDIFIGYV